MDRLSGRRQFCFSNFFASIVGAFMYFATLTEVPILQGLIASGMGKGPALRIAFGWTIIITSQYAGNPRSVGYRKNYCLYRIGSNYGNHFRNDLWQLF
jgi:hypothetical protein